MLVVSRTTISSLVVASTASLFVLSSSKSVSTSAVTPISSTANIVASVLKYLSISALMGAPYFQISPPIRKKRMPRPTTVPIINIGKLISHAPAVMVQSLKGSGVKPAVYTIQKFHLS